MKNPIAIFNEFLLSRFHARFGENTSLPVSSAWQALNEVAQAYAAKQNHEDNQAILDALLELLVEASVQSDEVCQELFLPAAGALCAIQAAELNALTFNWLWVGIYNAHLLSLEDLQAYLKEETTPFLWTLPEDEAGYLRLAESGCCTFLEEDSPFPSLAQLLQMKYPGLFSQGFEAAFFETHIGSVEDYALLLCPCLHNPNRLQLNAIDLEKLNDNMRIMELSEESAEKCRALFEMCAMPPEAVQTYLNETGAPHLKNVAHYWAVSPLCRLLPTPIGVILARLHYQSLLRRPVEWDQRSIY